MPSKKTPKRGPVQRIEIEVNGEKYGGSYRVEDDSWVIVSSDLVGQIRARVGGLGAEGMAKVLLEELVADNLRTYGRAK